MARHVQTTLVDDIDGGTADETVPFSWNGTSYEIDLSRKNADALRALLEPYIKAGRHTRSHASRRARGSSRSTTTSKQRNQAIREWARAQGLQIAERGRIPIEIMLRYDNRQQGRV
ncbi:Lsr2 family protein [Pseudonocardia kujensis]|uniref:histone-like nucleoid-structuring protein Lsr2 n=1 Tax=Pseudonocardia kujensis TaxID=1128675 RepID=UPI001E30F502|nr:Lsr2 family protein [Pseudonocardia kujensis]MCE0764938.1 Lsr2 family protein [Pseudonocardia kujensis]